MLEGFYLLQTLNGMNRPATITIRPGFQLEVLDASVGINAPPNFRSSTVYRKTENGQVTSYLEVCTGRYSYGAGALPRFAGEMVLSEFTVANSGCGREYTGSWDGTDKLTIDFDSATHSIYQK